MMYCVHSTVMKSRMMVEKKTAGLGSRLNSTIAIHESTRAWQSQGAACCMPNLAQYQTRREVLSRQEAVVAVGAATFLPKPYGMLTSAFDYELGTSSSRAGSGDGGVQIIYSPAD